LDVSPLGDASPHTPEPKVPDVPIDLQIVSPARLVLSRSVDMVVMPGYEGDLAAQENHAPMIVLLRGGVIALYDAANVVGRFFVAGGFAEITADRCTILADDAVPVEELNADQARRNLAAAEAAWAEVDKTDINARDAVLDRLQSTREAVRVSGAG
jgi:F-type H+-transporting ATPase subunit epsilon